MKKPALIFLLCFTLLLCFSLPAMAETTIPSDAHHFARNNTNGQYTVSDATDDGSVAVGDNRLLLMLVLRGVLKDADLDDMQLSVESLVYIDLTTTGTGGTYSFDPLIPKAIPDCTVVLIDADGKKQIAGYIAAVNTTVTCTLDEFLIAKVGISDERMATLTLTPTGEPTTSIEPGKTASSYSFENVPAATYTLKVELLCCLPFTIKNVPVESIPLVLEALTENELIIGNTNGDTSINGADLTPFFNYYGQAADKADAYNINGDLSVTGADLSALLANYGKSALEVTYSE